MGKELIRTKSAGNPTGGGRFPFSPKGNRRKNPDGKSKPSYLGSNGLGQKFSGGDILQQQMVAQTEGIAASPTLP